MMHHRHRDTRPNMRTRFAVLIAALCLPLQLGACSLGGSNDDNLLVLLTSTPNLFVDEAVVTVTSVTLVSTSTSLPLRDEPYTTDLSKLDEEVVAVLVADDVAPGTYRELRLTVDAAADVLFADSTRTTLRASGSGTTTLTLSLPPLVIDDGDERIRVTVDLSAAESFLPGANGAYTYRPAAQLRKIEIDGDLVMADTLDVPQP